MLVTGATGSGKTTTLAAVLNEINRTQAYHIVTLEDPVEFVHPAHYQSTFNQRELGTDFNTYPNGLRAALRQAPKVILVGEMRDRETVEIAMTAAETGHLVLSTLHTIDAGQSINRILGLFDQGEEKLIRQRLADTLRYVVSQRLAPRPTGGRQLIMEVMGNNLRTKEAIALGEEEGRNFYDIIEASETFGWFTFDQSIIRAYEAGHARRGNGPALRLQEGQGHPPDRPHQEEPRRGEEQGQRPAFGHRRLQPLLAVPPSTFLLLFPFASLRVLRAAALKFRFPRPPSTFRLPPSP